MSKHEFLEVRIPIEKDNPSIMRDESLCIKCGNCRRVCEQEIAVGRLYDMKSTDDKAICIHCGQCANVCPVDSITEKYEYQKVKQALADPKKVVIVSTSPSVRVALGEEFGMKAGSFVEGKMIAALRALGIPYVLDTNFGADLTIMEEANELIQRVTTKNKPLPQFTSCCPAWVKFVETFYPQMNINVSTSKSPIGMQGPTIKTFFAQQMNIDPESIVNVALTPCTAKKFEIRRPEMNASSDYLDSPNIRDMDFVITTRELAKWLKEENIDFSALQDSQYDTLMGAASGAGIIFGNTGGVMEAAARTAAAIITGKNPEPNFISMSDVRGMDGIRTTEITLNGVALRLAVIHGTDNAKKVLDDIQKGKIDYDFIEVMTCRGGCIGGGGQPKVTMPIDDEVRNARIKALYQKDNNTKVRFSHENPDITRVYEQFYQKPLSERAERMLHTSYIDRSKDLGVSGMVEKTPAETKKERKEISYRCTICGYVHQGEMDDDFKCPLCAMGKDKFVLVD
ncbi:MAG: [FeFe] hydrogenase, group A [Treponemataceae bacterium]